MSVKYRCKDCVNFIPDDIFNGCTKVVRSARIFPDDDICENFEDKFLLGLVEELLSEDDSLADLFKGN